MEACSLRQTRRSALTSPVDVIAAHSGCGVGLAGDKRGD